MKYIFSVEWEDDFVAFCKKHDFSPTAFIVDYAKEKFSDKIVLAISNEKYCQWVAPNLSEVEARPIYESLNNILVDKLHLQGKAKVMTVRYYPYGSSTAEQTASSDEGAKSDGSTDSLSKNPLSQNIEALAADLIGAGEFVDLVHEIAKVAPFTANGTLGEIFNKRHYLFSIDNGYELETYVDILAEALRKAGMFSGDDVTIDYQTISKESNGRESVFEHPLESINSRVDHMLCVFNISAWMDSVRTEDFRNFLQEVSAQSNNIVVFVIPFVEKDTLNRVYEGIHDVVDLRVVSFVPFNKDELQLTAERYLQSYCTTMTEDAWAVFHSMVLQEKADGTFYGVSTVKKICREILFAKTIYNADHDLTDMEVKGEQLQAVAPHLDEEQSAQAMLDKMVGLDAVRKKLYEIVGQIEAARNIPDMDMPSVHMRFVGNPGTGKTTVARIMGRMLKERGLLRIGDLYEVHGRDLVGRYIGETAPKTAGICRDAYGSVLFIDEAYSLCRDTGDTKDFGREALDTLIAQMENHRSDMVVIMAGYTDDIANMMKANFGLENRMPYMVEFPNYTRDELYRIFEGMVNRQGPHDEEILPEAKRFFDGLEDSFLADKSFGNGRYVRNLFERTRAKAIMRMQIHKEPALILRREDFQAATSDSEFRRTDTGSRKIGFN